jgi:glucose-6-phosphate isomerase
MEPKWRSLNDHKAKFSDQLKDLFIADNERFNKFHLVFGDILVDYSKNLVTAETMALLFKFLGEETQFEKLRAGMFSGEKINFTEGRPVLHVYDEFQRVVSN